MNPANTQIEEHPLVALLGLAVLAAVLMWLGGSPWTAPLEILVVFFHEASHALMTLVTGGKVVSMQVTVERGGEVLSAGGSRFLILSAGYLGSLLIGAALLVAGMRSRHDRAILAVVALFMALATVLFMRNLFGFGYGMAMAVALLAIAGFLPEQASDFSLRLIGVMSLLYVPRDIFSDTIERSQLQSDARMLAEEFGGGTWLWGGLWLLASLLICYLAVRWSLRPRRRSAALATQL
ncbi:MAG: M50 family metallopeptidase [Xanthomonadales bacterium]|nr:M50 family metallopeptidase [Xanthomonadales bacterium]